MITDGKILSDKRNILFLFVFLVLFIYAGFFMLRPVVVHAAAPAFGGELYHFTTGTSSTDLPPGTISLSSGVPAGDTIVVLGMDDGNVYHITGVTDSEGNTYSQAVYYNNTGYQPDNQSIWFAPVTTPLTASDTVTIAWGPASTTYQAFNISVIYLTGVATSSPLVGTAATSSYMYTASTTIPGTTTASSSVAVGLLAANDFVWTPSSGWNLWRSDNENIYYDYFYKTLNTSGLTDPGGSASSSGGTYSGIWAAFQATSTTTTSSPVISSFTASPQEILSGSTSTLSWSMTGVSSSSINEGIGTVSTSSGSIAVHPTSTTAYILTASNSSNTTTSSTVTVTIDTTPPTTPQSLTATSVGSSTISLTWASSTDVGGPGFGGYNIYRCMGSSCAPNILIATSSVASYSDISVGPSTTYAYAVSAYDTLGLTSATSTSITTTTLGASGCDGLGNCYIRMGAAGSGNGSSWQNAYIGFGTSTGDINPASMSRGVTYWVASGTYGGVAFSTPDSGTSMITLEGATDASHGPATDWNNAYAGQAVFGPSAISTDYWIINGQVRGSDWQSGYTMKFWNQNASSSSAITLGGNNDITFKYVEMEGTGAGFPNNTSTSDRCSTNNCGVWSDDAIIENSPVTNLYVGYGYEHNTGNTTFQMDTEGSGGSVNNNLTWEYNWISYNHTGQNGLHDQAFALYGSNVVIRYNTFQDISGSGIITTAGAGQPNLSNWDVYGNLFFWDSAYAALNGQYDLATIDNAVLDFLGEQMTGHIYFYNNTIADFYNSVANASGTAFSTMPISGLSGTGGSICGSTCPTVSIENNLWYNSAYVYGGYTSYCSVVTGAVCTENYNSSYQGGVAAGDDWETSLTPGANDVNTSGTANPFVNSASSTIAGFQLAYDTASGTTLAAPYNFDGFHQVDRGINGTWDRGAEQLQILTPTISSFSVSPTDITSGSSATLSWNTNNASSVMISPLNFTTSTISGSISVTPVSTTAYTLSAVNANGTSTESTVLTVTVSPVVISGGGGGGGGTFPVPIFAQAPTSTTIPSSSSSVPISSNTSLTATSPPAFLPSSALLFTQLVPLEKAFNDLLALAKSRGILLSYQPFTIPSAATLNPSFGNNLSLGDRNPEVTTLQHYLNTHGFPVVATPGYAGSLGYETQFFGPATRNALIKFQASHGIPATGFFGPITRGYIAAQE